MRLSEAVDNFLLETAAFSDLALNSTRSYHDRLKTFVDFLGDPEMDIAPVFTTGNIARYFHWLREQNFKETTTYAKKQALRLFWNWAYEKGLAHEKPEVRLRHPPKPKATYLTPEEARRMMAVARIGTGRFSLLHLRDRAAFGLLSETGIPIEAITRLSVDDYDGETHLLRCGALEILLSENLCQALDEYLEARKVTKRWSDKLFASCSGNTWHHKEVREAIQRHRQHTGLPPLDLGQPTHPKHWANDERLRFLQTPVRPYDRSAEQAQLVLGLGLHCGLRREEMANVKVGDVDLHYRELYILGKGSKKRKIPLNAHMVSLLEPIVVSRLPEETLLVGEDGSGLSVKRIGLIVSRLAKQAGITYKKVTPHTLRHSFATNLKDAGVAIDVIQKLLGHSNIADTERYLHTGEEQMRDAIERIWQD